MYSILPKRALKWMPKQKRARGRLKKNWMDGIRKAMNERNLNEGQWGDRKKWSLGVGQRRTTFRNRHTYVHTYIHTHSFFVRRTVFQINHTVRFQIHANVGLEGTT